jgi:hypothetical protein
LFPFLFWYGTWFGRKLTDAEITQYLHTAADKPRKAQHALVQIGERVSRGDKRALEWYPTIAGLALSTSVELRQTVAWIMGQDHTYQPFHEALRKLLADSSPMVRRNAALSLTNFEDASSRSELLAMLRPYPIVSPAAGVVRYRLKLGEFVNPGTLVGHVDSTEIRSALPGEVRSRLIRSMRGRPCARCCGLDRKKIWRMCGAMRGASAACRSVSASRRR